MASDGSLRDLGIRCIPPKVIPEARGATLAAWEPRWPGERAETFEGSPLVLVGPSGVLGDVWTIGTLRPTGTLAARRVGPEVTMRRELHALLGERDR